MATTLSTITSHVRNLLGDVGVTDSDLFTYSSSNVFTLTESNVNTVNEVSVNDISSGVSYTYNSTTNKITVTSSLTTGDTVEVNYSYYTNYSDTIIQAYVEASVIHIRSCNLKDFIVENSTIYPDPDSRERGLIAMVAALLIEPDNESYRLPDMSVTKPTRNDVPVHTKIRQLIAVFKKDTHGVIDVI